VKSSEIEGDHLNREQVRSSIARRLGIQWVEQACHHHVEGVVEMMVDATKNYGQPLTADRLFRMAGRPVPYPSERLAQDRVGAWRNDAHGPSSRVRTLLEKKGATTEAPASPRLDREMAAFLYWAERPRRQNGSRSQGGDPRTCGRDDPPF